MNRVRARHAQVLEQLNNWTSSAVTLRLIVSAEAFSVFHTGFLCRLTETEDVFVFEPNEGGGVFVCSPSECPSFITWTDTYTLVKFRNGKIVLKLMEDFLM